VDFVTSDQFAAQLRAALFRFDCPSPFAIGEYALDSLIDPERRLLAEHVLGCADCAGELQTFREFLATKAPTPKSAWPKVFATLFTPSRQPQLSALRGDARHASAEYHAGPVHVILGALPTRRRGAVTIDGLVLHDASPESVAGRQITLAAAEDEPLATTRTDDLGNFGFDEIAAGTYRLEIHFDDELVVIQRLTFGG